MPIIHNFCRAYAGRCLMIDSTRSDAKLVFGRIFGGTTVSVGDVLIVPHRVAGYTVYSVTNVTPRTGYTEVFLTLAERSPAQREHDQRVVESGASVCSDVAPENDDQSSEIPASGLRTRIASILRAIADAIS